MQFPRGLINSMWDFQKLINYLPCSFSGVSFFVTEFCGIFKGETLFCSEFLRVK